MTAKTMAEVLADHHSKSFNPERSIVFCLDVTCGWEADAENFAVAAEVFAQHQQDMLTAAGFGLVADPVVIHVHHDTEAHARSFNEGYESAVTQGLADDPSLAEGWFQEKLREAKTEAWDEGRKHGATYPYGERGLATDDNPYRAAASQGMRGISRACVWECLGMCVDSAPFRDIPQCQCTCHAPSAGNEWRRDTR